MGKRKAIQGALDAILNATIGQDNTSLPELQMEVETLSRWLSTKGGDPTYRDIAFPMATRVNKLKKELMDRVPVSDDPSPQMTMEELDTAAFNLGLTPYPKRQGEVVNLSQLEELLKTLGPRLAPSARRQLKAARRVEIMKPEDYIREAGGLPLDVDASATTPYLTRDFDQGATLKNVPYLVKDKAGTVTDHDGRNRMKAWSRVHTEPLPVIIKSVDDLSVPDAPTPGYDPEVGLASDMPDEWYDIARKYLWTEID